jgi:hypothetical protein
MAFSPSEEQKRAGLVHIRYEIRMLYGLYTGRDTGALGSDSD